MNFFSEQEEENEGKAMMKKALRRSEGEVIANLQSKGRQNTPQTDRSGRHTLGDDGLCRLITLHVLMEFSVGGV